MSYILDALNKSEQEQRKKRIVPGLDAGHRTGEPGRRPLWPWMLGICVLLVANAAGMYWWMVRDATPAPIAVRSAPAEPAETAPPTAAQTPAPVPVAPTQVAEPVQQQPAVIAGEGEVLITPSDFEARPARASANTNGATATEAVPINALPTDIQQQLPDLVFSSHIFASDADLRMVNINGKSLREGDEVSEGLTLGAITEDGVILTYRDYRFEVSVLRDWSF